MLRTWCDLCRGNSDGPTLAMGGLLACSTCERRYHLECCGLRTAPSAAWRCPHCVAGSDGTDTGAREAKAESRRRNAAMKRVHNRIYQSRGAFFKAHRAVALPFLSASQQLKAQEALHASSSSSSSSGGGAAGGSQAHKSMLSPIQDSPSYVNATLRPYQIRGVNWITQQYNQGVGGILGDEMGLGKTIQTLSWLATLKYAGQPGPHLVITPLAVLLNWITEIKRFTPGLSVVKIHGSASERDGLLSDTAVLAGRFDIYLTTYETLLSEEAFFTEQLLFHTVVIDEGHRLKNEASAMCQALKRVRVPFRLLLTGTPLQNNMRELWALLNYVIPRTFDAGAFDEAYSIDAAKVDRKAVAAARSLLDTVMLRRLKQDVETSLLPKQEFLIKVPLTAIQRRWYQRMLQRRNDGAGGLMSLRQLQALLMQLQKIVNHPKCILHQYDRDRRKEASRLRQAEGAEFVKARTTVLSGRAQELEGELRSLHGEQFVAASGKLAVLDRLLLRAKADGSRVLIFSQFTLTLDCLEEYCDFRFGPDATLRLDGSTNRIRREMDVRAFNAPASPLFAYLISTRAGGQGINLATADVVILYDTCWNPTVDQQAMDRAHRIGQKKQVRVYRFIAESTMEERILARAQQKFLLTSLVVNNEEQQGSNAEATTKTEEGEDGVEKLSTAELWSMLKHGARRIFDPAAAPPVLDAGAMDKMLDTAKPGMAEEVRRIRAAAERHVDEQGQALTTPSGILLARPSATLLVSAHDDGKGDDDDDDDGVMQGSIFVADRAPKSTPQPKPGPGPKQQQQPPPPLPPSSSPSPPASSPDRESSSSSSSSSKDPAWASAPTPTPTSTSTPTPTLTSIPEEGVTAATPDEDGEDQQVQLLPEGEILVPRRRLTAAALTAFYAEHNPENVPIVQAILSGYTDDEIMAAAQLRYCATPRLLPERRCHGAGAAAPKKTTKKKTKGKVNADGKRCVHCGSTQHLRRKHRDCPCNGGCVPTCLKDTMYRPSSNMARATAAAREATAAAAVVRGKRSRKKPNWFSRQKAPSLPEDVEMAKKEKKEKKAQRQRLVHDTACFCCHGAGDPTATATAAAAMAASAPVPALALALMACPACPRVYHPACLRKVGGDALKTGGKWRCPWHKCSKCGRRSSAAGGLLFHCATCVATFCFDCCPSEYTAQHRPETAQLSSSMQATLEAQHCSAKSYLFFSCERCTAAGKTQPPQLAPADAAAVAAAAEDEATSLSPQRSPGGLSEGEAENEEVANVEEATSGTYGVAAVGELIYAIVAKEQPSAVAGKVTGMLLQGMALDALRCLPSNLDRLRACVDEALAVLAEAEAGAGDAPVPTSMDTEEGEEGMESAAAAESVSVAAAHSAAEEQDSAAAAAPPVNSNKKKSRQRSVADFFSAKPPSAAGTTKENHQDAKPGQKRKFRLAGALSPSKKGKNRPPPRQQAAKHSSAASSAGGSSAQDAICVEE